MLPDVVLQNIVSVDGRIEGFPADIGLYYELLGVFQVDAHLAGSRTIYQPEREETPPETPEDLLPPEVNLDDPRPLLVVVDSGGRVRNWHALRAFGAWRRMVALCSHSTPEEYLTYLRERHVEVIVAGEKQVDLRAALAELNARYGVRRVFLDSGGTLNGVMLRAGLVREISVLISPYLVGGTSPRSLYRAPDLAPGEEAIPLRLTHFERLREDIVWLRYEVASSTAAGSS